MNIKAILYHFCLLTKQDFFITNYRTFDYMQLRKSECLLSHTRVQSGVGWPLVVTSVACRAVNYPFFPSFPLSSSPHCLLSFMHALSWSLCGCSSPSFQTSPSTSRNFFKKAVFPSVSFHQRGTHFLEALKKMSFRLYWLELCHVPMTNPVTGKGYRVTTTGLDQLRFTSQV